MPLPEHEIAALEIGLSAGRGDRLSHRLLLHVAVARA
jgi:hypothetical protein